MRPPTEPFRRPVLTLFAPSPLTSPAPPRVVRSSASSLLHTVVPGSPWYVQSLEHTLRAPLTRSPSVPADRTTPFTFQRWGSTAALFVIFTLRILWVQAYYIVAYALGSVPSSPPSSVSRALSLVELNLTPRLLRAASTSSTCSSPSSRPSSTRRWPPTWLRRTPRRAHRASHRARATSTTASSAPSSAACPSSSSGTLPLSHTLSLRKLHR